MQKSSLSRCAALAASVAISNFAYANSYTLVDLGAQKTPLRINKNGQIAGTNLAVKPEVYRDDGWHVLLCRPSVGEAYGINSSGLLVGYTGTTTASGTTNFPREWTPGDGACTTLPLPTGATGGAASAIAENGTVTGSFSTSSGGTHCFLDLPGGSSEDIGVPGNGTYCASKGLNEANAVIGAATTKIQDHPRAFLWQDGTFQIIGVLGGGSTSSAEAVNRQGHVVGWSQTSTSSHEAFAWTGGAIRDIGSASSFLETVAADINDVGEIVGYGIDVTGSSEAVRFENGEVITLASEVENLGKWQLTAANGINKAGVIVGTGTFNGKMHGYMLTPLINNH